MMVAGRLWRMLAPYNERVGTGNRKRPAQDASPWTREGPAVQASRSGPPGDLRLLDRAPSDLRADREGIRGLGPGSGPHLVRQDPAPDPPFRHRDGGHSPLRTGTTASRPIWPRSPRCSSRRGASAPVPARSNAPDTTATGSRSLASRPAPATEHRPRSTYASCNPDQQHDRLTLRGIGLRRNLHPSTPSG